MEKILTLRDVPKEYFGKFSKPRPVDGGLFWGCMLCYLVLLILSAAFFDGDHPVMKYATGAIFILAGLFIFPSIFFSSNKLIRRFPKTNMIFGIISMEILCLILINLITAANYLYCDSLFYPPIPVLVYIIGGLIYLQHIITMIFFWKRIKRCIINGCYLPGGTGFWTKKLLPKVMFLSAIMPTLFSMAISVNVCSIATDWSITLTEGIYPLVALFFLLMAEVLAVIFAYGNANVIAQYNYVKIYGSADDGQTQEQPEENAEVK